MPLTAGRVSVGSTPTLVMDTADNQYPRLLIKNTGATELFIGPSNVTITNGFSIASGATQEFNALNDSGDDLYAVAAASGTLSWLAW